MRLTFEQSRVLASMIEKAMTTPANYPMSLNAVVVACNQVSNREPVTEFGEDEVELTLRGLADEGLVKMVHRPGDRVVKYRHALDEPLEVSEAELALLAVLMLRGAQTPGELRQRTSRYVEFVSLPELEETLLRLTNRDLVRRLARQPGQKESRYEQLLWEDGAPGEVAVGVSDALRASPGSEPSDQPHGGDLAARVDELERRFDELLDRLGEEIR